MLLNKNCFLAVYMITYNHENYIAQAIESVLMQKAEFNFKLFIGEDFSTDSTRTICLDYKNKYPDKIELLLQEKNIGPQQNAQTVYKACFDSGAKYIAMLEGDDYWTDPYKLQKQVDFLEANPEYSLCFHKAKRVDADNNELGITDSDYGVFKKIEQKWMVGGIYFPTASVLFRNILNFKNFESVPNGDTYLWAKLGHYGPAAFLPDILPNAYRVHCGGVWSLRPKLSQLENGLKTYNAVLKFADYKYINVVKTKIMLTYLRLGKISFANGDYNGFFKNINKGLHYFTFSKYCGKSFMKFLLGAI